MWQDCCSDLSFRVFLPQVLLFGLGHLVSWSYLSVASLAGSLKFKKEMLFSFGCSATPPVGLGMQTSASFCPYMGDNSLKRGEVELSMRPCFRANSFPASWVHTPLPTPTPLRLTHTHCGPAKCRQWNVSTIAPCQLRKCHFIISQRGAANTGLFLQVGPHFCRKGMQRPEYS